MDPELEALAVARPITRPLGIPQKDVPVNVKAVLRMYSHREPGSMMEKTFCSVFSCCARETARGLELGAI